MKKYKTISYVVVLSIFVISGCSALQNATSGDGSSSIFSSSDAQTSGIHTISISGTGTVSLVPDMASISIGVQTNGAVAAVTVAANNLQTDLVFTVLTDFGIDSRDMSTTNFSVSPIHTRNTHGEVTSTTFQVQNTVKVTVRNLDDLGAILDGVVTAGANTIYGITFELNDVAKKIAKDKALEDAMSDARRQADLLASAAGVKVVGVISVTVNADGGPVTFAQNQTLALGAASDVPISAGVTEISYQVYVVFEVTALAAPAPTAIPTGEAALPPNETPLPEDDSSEE